MSALYCTVCRHQVPPGYNWCTNCNQGYVPVLACTICHQSLQRGGSSCHTCSRGAGSGGSSLAVRPPESHVPLGSVGLPPVSPQLPLVRASLDARVPDRYEAGRHGVSADVQIPTGDAELMTTMLRAAALLQELAARLNGFQAHMELTRSNIRACRMLALDLQEEVERRRGPQVSG